MEAKKRVAIETSVFGEVSRGLAMLQEAGLEVETRLMGAERRTEEARAAVLKDADAVIAGTEPYPDALLRQCPRLKILSRVGVGLDNVDFRVTSALGIEVAYTPDAVSRAVAEMTLGMIIALTRHIARADRELRAGVWKRHIGIELHGRTAGIIGLGRIGKLVARSLRAIGMTVLANDLEPDEAFCKAEKIASVTKEEIWASCDVVTLHLPLTRLTRGLVNDAALKAMKKTAYLVNTARGPVVDTPAIVKALTEGRIAGAALDVFEAEPYEGPLTGMPNVLLTSHMASCSDVARRGMEEGAAQNVIDFLAGKVPPGRVPPELRMSDDSAG